MLFDIITQFMVKAKACRATGEDWTALSRAAQKQQIKTMALALEPFYLTLTE